VGDRGVHRPDLFMAARELQRGKRRGITARRLYWPAVVLAGGIVLSRAANLAQAQPDAWGRVMAATPCGAFLVAVSMLERRATASRHHGGPAPSPDLRAVPDQDAAPGLPSPAGRPSGTDADTALLESARRAEHQQHPAQPDLSASTARQRERCTDHAAHRRGEDDLDAYITELIGNAPR
jgi:hypothetical protein